MNLHNGNSKMYQEKSQQPIYVPVAQKVEQLTFNQWVGGSSLPRHTIYAEVMELADISDLKSADRNIVRVQIPSSAPSPPMSTSVKLRQIWHME